MQPVLRPPANPLTPFVRIPPPFPMFPTVFCRGWSGIGPAARVLANGEAVPVLDAGRASEVILAVSAADMPDIMGGFATDAHIPHSRAVAATRNLYEVVVPGLVEAFEMLYYGADSTHLEDHRGDRVKSITGEQ